MIRRAWRPVAATTALVGSSSYIYYSYYYSRKAVKDTFELPVKIKGPDGKRSVSTRSLQMISLQEVENRLKAHALSQAHPLPTGVVWRHTTAFLASNDPIEDANSSAIVERDPSPDAPPGHFLFYSVFDGHSGYHTSRLLSKTLIPAVALQLSQLLSTPEAYASKPSGWSSLLSYFKATSPKALDDDPEFVSKAIQSAFVMADSEIVGAPLRLLRDNWSKESPLPDLSQHPMALSTMLPALSGSCALLALLDTARENLYVALAGDCRAVAGIWEENEDGKGQWRVEVLSEDQTGRNPKELQRIRSEHPPDEAEDVIQRGRVLGGLEPSRAFGDARYKWPAEVQFVLNKVFMVGNERPMSSPPQKLKTPPYVTSLPVVTHRKLPSTSSNEKDSVAAKSGLRFLILATDGLWDEITSSEAVALVGGHLAKLSGSVSKKDLKDLVPTVLSSDPSARTVEGKDKSRASKEEGSWAFVDDNVSIHLIRNAFGGADTDKLRRLLSIPAPLSRSYRDDVTVTVVWWDENDQQSQEFLKFPLKAKL